LNPVLIIGGGVIGLSIGRELARAGCPVVVIERGEAGRGTSWLNAGMLAPQTEMGFEDQPIYLFGKESMARWPGFARDLEADTGMRVDYRTEGTMHIAPDRDSLEALRRVYQFQKSEGLEVEWLTGSEALDREPFLAPALAGAVYAAGDHQVDNRLLVEALKAGFLKHGGTLLEHTAVASIAPDDTAPAVVLASGERLVGRTVVLAAGAWSRQVDGLAPEARPAVRPVKGQIIQVQMEPPFGLRHVVWSPRAYIAPKSSGRLLIGATVEEMGFDTRVTAGGMSKLLEGVWESVPGIMDLAVTETWAGLRPGTRDHLPLLGASAAPGVLFATGHYRNGILFTPITAHEMSRLILEGETSHWLEPFSPLRF
ncbi:MAG: glycine oxidase ThiO, partial [Rhodothermales bacterium]|nr:glycine oxidase ThiO [Rhodothermales bacterium]